MPSRDVVVDYPVLSERDRLADENAGWDLEYRR